MSDATSPAAPKPLRRTYIPAVGPRLRILMWFVFILVAVLGFAPLGGYCESTTLNVNYVASELGQYFTSPVRWSAQSGLRSDCLFLLQTLAGSAPSWPFALS